MIKLTKYRKMILALRAIRNVDKKIQVYEHLKNISINEYHTLVLNEYWDLITFTKFLIAKGKEIKWKDIENGLLK